MLDKINAYFAPIREKRRELAARPGYVEEVLRRGAERARSEPRATMDLVRHAVSMNPSPGG